MKALKSLRRRSKLGHSNAENSQNGSPTVNGKRTVSNEDGREQTPLSNKSASKVKPVQDAGRQLPERQFKQLDNLDDGVETSSNGISTQVQADSPRNNEAGVNSNVSSTSGADHELTPLTKEDHRIEVTRVEDKLNGTVNEEQKHISQTLRSSVATHSQVPADGRAHKKLILNAFVEMCSGHQSPGLWRHPDDQSRRFNEVKYWMELAQLLEAGKFHGIFIADVLGGYDIYGGPRNLPPAIRSGAQWPVNEPLAVVPAMAAVTENIGIGVTVSTTYEQPYHLARRLSTIDHLTNGRSGWNVVTGYLDSAARNLGRNEQPEHDERYRVCEEYMEVMYKLWQSSWREGSVVHDKKANIYTDPAGVREINHVGKYFNVPGPHICQPSKQRVPVIMQAGTSKSGKAFAAKHAEAIFVSGHSPAASAKAIKEIREQAAEKGRDPSSIKVLAKICPIIGHTQEDAEAKYREYLQYGSEEGALALFGGWTGVDMSKYGDDEELRYVESNAIRSYIEGLVKHGPKVGTWTKKTLAEHIIVGGLGATPVGTVEHVADEFERWVDEADVDGFNIAYAIMPQTFIDVIELLLPELRRRGIFWDDYAVPGGTYRENLTGFKNQKYPSKDHPASGYLWKEESVPSHATPMASKVYVDDSVDPIRMQLF